MMVPTFTLFFKKSLFCIAGAVICLTVISAAPLSAKAEAEAEAETSEDGYIKYIPADKRAPRPPIKSQVSNSNLASDQSSEQAPKIVKFGEASNTGKPRSKGLLNKIEGLKFKRTKDLTKSLMERYGEEAKKSDFEFSSTDEEEIVVEHTMEENYYNIVDKILGSEKTISLEVSDDIHVKEVILEISRLSGVNVEIDPMVDGYVILSLKNKSIYEVLQRLAEVAHLKMSIKGDVVRFEPDLPTTVNYTLGFLDVQRKSSMSYSLNTAVDAQGQGGAKDSISSTNETSLWTSLEAGLKNVLKEYQGSEYAINTQAGIVSVTAISDAHRSVRSYVDKVRKFATTQILIEMKLVEVSLKDEFRSGVSFNFNQNAAGSVNNNIINSTGTRPPSTANIGNASDGFAYTFSNQNLEATVSMVSEFGNAKTISSPRLSVLNNQQSIISFATNQVYFEVKPTLQNQFIANGTNGTGVVSPNVPIIVDSIMKTIPIGVILSIQAVADPDTSDIMMSIRPSISEITGYATDPATAYLTSTLPSNSDVTISNQIPIVQKREMDAILKIKSGDVMVIGGFTRDRVENQRVGIPILKDIPLFGLLFGAQKRSSITEETLIFIKASIVPSNAPLTPRDQVFYDRFAHTASLPDNSSHAKKSETPLTAKP